MSELHEETQNFLEKALTELLSDFQRRNVAAIELLWPDAQAVGCGIRVVVVQTMEKMESLVTIEADVPAGEVDWMYV